MQEVRNERAFKYKRQFYILAIILTTILFVYFLHIALYHCPKQIMSTKRKGRKETKEEPPTQYRVIDPVSLANLENIHTRKGKYPTVPPFGQPTWEDVKREKEERLRKAIRERSLSTPLESTSTDAMDTEEAQEFSKEIAAKAAEKELRKQRYTEYQLKRQQTTSLIFLGHAQSQFLNWKSQKKRKSLGHNLYCLILVHPIMKRYPLIGRDHLLGQGQSQLPHWSQTTKRNHREPAQRYLPVMYQPFKTIPLT